MPYGLAFRSVSLGGVLAQSPAGLCSLSAAFLVFSRPCFSFSLWTNTMNRCDFKFSAALLALAATFAAGTASAQMLSDKPFVREFPATALRGQMVVMTPPEISMDGKADRLSPGARLRDVNNQLVLTGAVVNQRLTVNYLRDNLGQVQQVWILSEEEASLKRPNSPRSMFNFVFGSTPDPAPKDDGKTPYDQLPSYKP
jgi:hypothetical protein